MSTRPAASGGDSLSPDVFRDVIGRFASGVTVITAVHEGTPFGTTASAISSLSLEPPMLLACMNLQSSTGRAVAASGRFAVNVLAEDQIDVAMRFARKGSDKFRGIQLSGAPDGPPLLEYALATLECRVVQVAHGGTHSIFLSEVDNARARAGYPLAYFRGRFGRLELVDDEGKPRHHRPRLLGSSHSTAESTDSATHSTTAVRTCEPMRLPKEESGE